MSVKLRRVQAPGPDWIKEKIAQGITTDPALADAWFKETNQDVSRSGINRIIRLYDLRPKKKKYDNFIPWVIKREHAGDWYHKLLIAEARRRLGLPLSRKFESALPKFKEDLARQGKVVAYVPDSRDGFYLVPAEPGEELITTRTRLS